MSHRDRIPEAWDLRNSATVLRLTMKFSELVIFVWISVTEYIISDMVFLFNSKPCYCSPAHHHKSTAVLWYKLPSSKCQFSIMWIHGYSVACGAYSPKWPSLLSTLQCCLVMPFSPTDTAACPFVGPVGQGSLFISAIPNTASFGLFEQQHTPRST